MDDQLTPPSIGQPPTRWLNFDLRIERSADPREPGDYVRVLQSPGGEVITPFVPPFSRADLDAFAQIVDQPQPSEQSIEAIRTYGARLFDAVFVDRVRIAFHASLLTAYQERTRLRLRLHFDEKASSAGDPASEWVQWPWEYLYDRERDEFPALSIHSPLVRYVALQHHVRPLPIEPPLRVLVVMADPINWSRLTAERRWLNFVDTVDYLAKDGSVLFERLKEPTLLALQRRLREKEFHVLHILSHGAWEGGREIGQLVLEDEMRRSRRVDGNHLGSLLNDHFSLRAVLLNAGDGGRSFADNPFTDVAQRLVRRGVPAAVALPFALPDSTQLAFADEFYAGLADRRPISEAVTEGRRSIMREGEAWRAGMPTLFSRVPDGQLFELPLPRLMGEAATRERPDNGIDEATASSKTTGKNPAKKRRRFGMF